MSNSGLFRMAGYASLVTTLLWIVSLGVGSVNPALASPIFAAATIVFMVPVYALYIVHRAQSSGMALGAALLTAVGLIATLFTGDPAVPANAILYEFSYVVFAIGIVLFGWLAYHSAKMPRGLAIAALVSGVLSLVVAIAYAGGTGMAEIANLLNYGSNIPFFVWMIWLSLVFLSGKLATA